MDIALAIFAGFIAGMVLRAAVLRLVDRCLCVVFLAALLVAVLIGAALDALGRRLKPRLRTAAKSP
jgi:hypothetical protein